MSEDHVIHWKAAEQLLIYFEAGVILLTSVYRDEYFLS